MEYGSVALPVRVYDPLVLEAGELLVRYVDVFTCLPAAPPSYGAVSFYRAVVPEEWHRLGTLGVARAGCPNINGQQWMIAVKENPARADPTVPPLVAPRRDDWYASYGQVGHTEAAFRLPECPAGYVAMGSVEYPESVSPHEPDAGDATCIRQDLTVPGVSGDQFLYYWANRTTAPVNSRYDDTTLYLEAEQNHRRTFTKGISQDDSTTISHTAGVSLTVESGVQFLGAGGKVSATVSYQFGYASQHSVGQFEEESTQVSINVPPPQGRRRVARADDDPREAAPEVRLLEPLPRGVDAPISLTATRQREEIARTLREAGFRR